MKIWLNLRKFSCRRERKTGESRWWTLHKHRFIAGLLHKSGTKQSSINRPHHLDEVLFIQIQTKAYKEFPSNLLLEKTNFQMLTDLWTNRAKPTFQKNQNSGFMQPSNNKSNFRMHWAKLTAVFKDFQHLNQDLRLCHLNRQKGWEKVRPASIRANAPADFLFMLLEKIHHYFVK